MKHRFPKNLRIIREARGLTQTQLGLALGFKSHLGIIRLEKAQAQPRLETLLGLCEALNVDLQTLVFAEPFAHPLMLGKGDTNPWPVPIASQILPRSMAGATYDFCPHPARNGSHEWYEGIKAGSITCHACAFTSTQPADG